ncbi:MAG TPA: NUDIX domain-containing protein [Caulobacteraceae bacterium]|jgi:8-oxo-dGTP pyrophosphatase MutT (NUDIX family)|nr:NUDIX domain-containing protein [Caulobacteraceae bacterium]
MRTRRTARVLLLDPKNRILLLKGRLPSDPQAPGAWFTVGGGIEPGESVEAAARREIAEETGFDVAQISEPLWTGELQVADRKQRPVLVHETFVLARCAGGEPSREGWVALEREFVDDIRWWTLAQLRTCPDEVWPHDLAERLAGLLAGSPPVQAG